jgi:hypothetical protein
MKSPLLFALAIAASISTTALWTPSYAQAPKSQAQAPQGQPVDDEEASPADREAFFNAHLAALKAVLGLNAEQEKLWPPVEAAIRDAAKSAAERYKKRHAGPEPTNVLEMLAVVADAEAARAEALKKFIAAATPLVASLTPEQKRRLPAYLGLDEMADHGPSSAELWIFEEEMD